MRERRNGMAVEVRACATAQPRAWVRRARFASTCTRAWALLQALVAVTLAQAQGAPSAPEHPSGWIDKIAVESRRFMVGAANPLATRAGYDILRAGGNAADATIAIQLV